MKQVHGNTIIERDDSNREREADGVFTRSLDTEVFVFTADCLPVLFASDNMVAAVHSGWRGTKKGIVRAMLAKYGADTPRTIILGPCLKSCCFEVKEDFVQEFSAERGDISGFLISRDGKQYFDLVSFVLERELAEFPKAKVDLSHNRCTLCSEPLLPSYRRNKGTDPRIRAFIKMVD